MMVRILVGWLLILSAASLLVSCGGGTSGGTRIDIKRGGAPAIDGILSEGEWSDADSVRIGLGGGWSVQVFFKHDRSNLYAAFSNLVNNGKRVYPEILLDVSNGKTVSWNSDDWWFHASYNDCEAKGGYGLYTFGEKGSCKKDHIDWVANNFPLDTKGNIELQIPYAKIGLIPKNARKIGIAFDVTDARTEWHFWPAGAKLENPSTWAVATSSDGWN